MQLKLHETSLVETVFTVCSHVFVLACRIGCIKFQMTSHSSSLFLLVIYQPPSSGRKRSLRNRTTGILFLVGVIQKFSKVVFATSSA